VDTRNEENLKRLFEGIGDAERAHEYAEDIGWGEEIFREHPAPEVDEEVTARIKAEVAGMLTSKSTVDFMRMVYRVAAVLVIVGVLSIGLFLRKRDDSPLGPVRAGVPVVIWDSEDIAADDVDLATLAAEIEQIEGELLAIESGESMGTSFGELEELEAELLDIDSDFWKG